MDFNLDTSSKVISAIAGLIGIVTFLFIKNRASERTDSKPNSQQSTSSNTQNVTLNVGHSGESILTGPTQVVQPSKTIAELKRTARVLFIDDDRGFKIVGILKKMGWEHTKIVADINSLEQEALTEADVIFVDVQGVGKAMQYAEEGLGLALAIKRRYSAKKVIIYSAQEEGDRFHEALQEADYSLPKTAEPIRFEDAIVRVLSK